MRYLAPGIGKPLGLMPPPRDDDEASPHDDGDHVTRGPSPRWRESSYDSYDGDDDLGNDDDDPEAPYRGWEIHEKFVKEDEA